MFKKIGENLNLGKSNLLTPKEALGDEDIAKRFVKLAKKLKRVAPRAKDFLYSGCIMMHAAEAALVDQSTGKPILNKEGNPVSGRFEKVTLDSGKESVKWISEDGIMPYKNANSDIFPEEELIKAHKMWISKPLCKDHKSDSVDGIRGIIIDTYYDPKFKRVHALFALDRKNYGDLARKVETGYANAVSMGTAVGRSVCTDCGNVAATERDYCNCIRARKNYGEINLDLNPIELSLVVNGADGLAKIKSIVASMNNYITTKQARIDELVNNKCVNPAELQSLADSVKEIQIKLNCLMSLDKVASVDKKAADLGELVAALKKMEEAGDTETASIIRNLIKEQFGEQSLKEESKKTDRPARAWPPTGGGTEPRFSSEPAEAIDRAQPVGNRLAYNNEEDKQGASSEISLLRSKIESLNNSFNELKQIVSKEENNMNSARLRARAKARRAYWLGGGGVNEPTPGKEKYPKEEADKIRDTEDKHMVGEPLDTGSEGLHPGDEEKLRDAGRDGLNLGKDKKAELEERKMKRRAYWLGGGGLNEPTPGKEKYPKEEADKIRDTEDKHMTGTYDMGGTDGMVPGDEQTKKTLLRAKLRAKFTKVADERGNLRKDASRWDIYAGDKLILSATGSEIYGEELDSNWDYLKSKDYGLDVMRHIRTDGFENVAYLLKGAQPPADPLAGGAPADPLAAPEAPAPDAAPPAEAPAPEGEEVKVEKPKDETKGKIEAALNEMEEKIAEIRDIASGMEGEELVDIDVTVEDQDSEGAGEAAAPTAESPMEGALAHRKNLMTVLALMDESADELALASEALEVSSDSRLVKAAKQALEDSKIVLAEATTVIAKKKDKDEDEDKKDDKKDDDKKDDKKDEDKKDSKKEAAEKCKECNMLKQFCKCKGKKDDKKDDDKKDDDKKDDKKDDDKKKKAQDLLDEALRVRAENRAALLSKAMGTPLDEAAEGKAEELVGSQLEQMLDGPCEGEDCMDFADDKGKKDKDDEDEDEKEDEKDEKDEKEDEDDASDFIMEDPASVFAARRQAREKLVAEAADKILGKYDLGLDKAQNATEPKYFEAHPGGKGTATELTHTKTPEAHVETISEIHDVMRDVAESGPRNVREAAELIQNAIVKGALKAEDLDQLVAEGKVDSAAASYWKKYFGQASDAGSFGADLSKEFATKKKEASDESLRIKMRRAYDVGLEAQGKGFIDATRAALDTYVDDLMKMDDGAFESTKRIIAKMSSDKKSGKLPRVSADVATEAMNVTASTDSAEPDWYNQLGSLGWK